MPDKDPDARLDYGWDWGSKWLGDDTLSASSWSFDEAGDGELAIASSSFTDTTTTVWVTGGTVGKTYRLTNHITTAAGREDDRTLQIRVKER